MPVRAAVLDIGETVLDDTREWNAWADWIGVGQHTFSTVLGAVTASGRDNAEMFRYFKPDFDVAAERQRREDVGNGEQIGESDLYPDVRTALAKLQHRGGLGRARRQPDRQGREPASQARPPGRRDRYLG